MAEEHFLYNPFTRIRTLTRPEILGDLPQLARLLLTKLDHYIAARFTHPAIRQVLGYPAVFLGTDPSAAPAMYHLMSALDLDEGVQYPQGGFRQVVERIEALAREAGAQIVTGAEVNVITTRREEGAGGSRGKVSGVTWRDATGRQRTEAADIVVSAADLHHTETELVEPAKQTYPERWWQKRTSGPGAVLVLLGVTGELPKLTHHTLFFTTDWADNFDRIFGAETSVPNPASFYACMPSATDPGVAPDGASNLFLLIPVPADTGLGHGGVDGAGSDTVEGIADAAIGQLAEWAGIPDLAERIVVRRTIGPADFADDLNSWKGGALGPAHTLKQSAFFRGTNVSRHIDGLYYAGGSTIPGIGLPMCLISAEILLKRIRGDVSTGPLPEPLPSGPAGARVR